jgi:hypothetical protein
MFCKLAVFAAMRQLGENAVLLLISKRLGPSACTVEDPKDLDCVADQTVWHDVWRPRNHQLARPWNPTRAPHFGAARNQRLNIAYDVERNTLRSRRIVMRNVSPQRRDVGNRFWRPD